jgi:hypothetical protein
MSMTDPLRKLILLALASSLPVALFAQDELLNEEQPPIKRYTVELVVFAYAEDVSVGTEVFPGDIIEPPAEEDDEIAEIEVTELQRRHPDFIGLEPVLLTEEEFTMLDVFERFELLDAYEPILHVGWTQVGSPRSDTSPMQLTDFGVPPVGLDGSFTLYLGNYLHLVVDLALDAPVAEYEFIVDDEPAYVFSDSRFAAEAEPEAIEGPVRYRLQENRIVKNAETRYFDHPKFGVVAKVVRVEDLVDEEELAVQPPLIGSVTQ